MVIPLRSGLIIVNKQIFRIIMNSNELLTIAEVATALKTCKETVRRRIRTGAIQAVKEPGKNGRYLVYHIELQNYIKSFEV